MKIIFAGTTEFGIPVLEKLKQDLVLIVTQPDKAVGRKKTLTPPPVKIWAEKNNIPVIQPVKISEAEKQLLDLDADMMLVAAYGQIIPKTILDIPKHGSVNIHGSLLPKYRGATPIQAAIINNDKTTGITLIKMDEKMDHGPIISCAAIDIEPDDTYMTLHEKLSLLAAEITPPAIQEWGAGRIQAVPQNDAEATYVKLLNLDDGRIDWTLPAAQVMAKIRALSYEPGTWTTYENKSVKIMIAEPVSDNLIELPGKIYETNKDLMVKCQTGSLRITKLQLEGKKPISGKDFLNGLKNSQNKLFV